MTVEEAILILHRAIRITGINAPGMTERDLANIAIRNAKGTDQESAVAEAVQLLDSKKLITGDDRLTQRDELDRILVDIGMTRRPL